MESLTTIANRHDFTNTFTNEYDRDQSANTIITPDTGKRIRIKGVFLSTEGATSAGQYVQLHFTASADTIVKVFCTNAVQNTSLEDILVEGALNEPVKITSTLGTDKNYFVAVKYIQVP